MKICCMKLVLCFVRNPYTKSFQYWHSVYKRKLLSLRGWIRINKRVHSESILIDQCMYVNVKIMNNSKVLIYFLHRNGSTIYIDGSKALGFTWKFCATNFASNWQWLKECVVACFHNPHISRFISNPL